MTASRDCGTAVNPRTVIKDHIKGAGYVILLFFALTGLAAGLRLFLFRLAAVDMVTYRLWVYRDCFSPVWCLAAGLPALWFFRRGSFPRLKKAALVWSPFALCLLLPEENFFFFPLFLLISGWVIFRLATQYGGREVKTHPLLWRSGGEKIFPWLVMAVCLLAAAWGVYMQIRAYRTLYLCYSDWGIYAESGLRMASGAAGWKEWLSTGRHWNPAANVPMALLMRLAPFPDAVFVFNSLLIYSAVPLTWLICRKLGLIPFHAFCFALMAAFNPVYGNLSLCLFYGFHPVYFAIPVLLLFFYFQERKNKIGMAVCLLCTLFLKETMMIFWFGYGLWLLARRRWKPGAWLTGGCLAGFCILSCIVLPHLTNTETYPQTYHYFSLGKTPLEVALSPFRRPGTFFGIAFQWQNCAFLLTLLTPLFFCVWLFPGMMTAVLPLLGGICLRASPEAKSIALQYGTETMTLLLALAVLNFHRLKNGERSFWTRLLSAGLRKKYFSARTTLTALAAATLTVSILSHYCFARTWWGKYLFHGISSRPDHRGALRETAASLPPGCRVLAPERLRGHFMFSHPTADYAVKREPGDFIILDLYERWMDSPEKLERVRREIAFDAKIIPVSSCFSYGKCFAVFQVTDHAGGKSCRPLTRMSGEQFAAAGVPLQCGDPHFAVRCRLAKKRRIFFFRIQKTPDYDVDIHCLHPGGRERTGVRIPFAWGVYPAYSCPEGTVFAVEFPASPATGIKIRITERPASRIRRKHRKTPAPQPQNKSMPVRGQQQTRTAKVLKMDFCCKVKAAPGAGEWLPAVRRPESAARPAAGKLRV